MIVRKVLALLMCVVVALIAASPLAQSEPGTVHEITKDENGPPSTCAETWEVTPPKDWTWHGHIVNYGLRWLIIDVIDIDTGEVLIDREMYRFALYPGGWVDTIEVNMVAGHRHSITATPNGPLGSSCTVEDVLEGGPVAAFTVSVDGTTVVVDASASYDPDGTIASYDWNWGDGTVGSGETASHTYVAPETVTAPLVSALSLVQTPYRIGGWTTDVNGIAVPYCTVFITDVRLGLVLATQSGNDGYYMVWLPDIGYVYQDGDEIQVVAVKDDLFGTAVGYVNADDFVTYIDVMMEWSPPSGPFDVPITLTVTDDDGLTDTMSQTVTIGVMPPLIPPVAAFSVSVDGLTVSVDASSSYDYDGTIVSYDWDFGDGSVGTGMIATHTYVPIDTAAVALDQTLAIEEPCWIAGVTYDVDSNPLPDCLVKVTNVRTGQYYFDMSDQSGHYMIELNYFIPGDEIFVEAVKDTLYGSAVGTAPLGLWYTLIDVTLEECGASEVTITLTVTDNDGIESKASQIAMLVPSLVEPEI